MSNWRVNWRIVGSLVALVGAILAALLAQHQAAAIAGTPSPLSPTAAFWLTWVVGACALAGPALPSIFGQSSVAPPGTSETHVVREATREAVVDILGGNDNAVRRELERVSGP